MWQRLKEFYFKYERRLSSVALLVGFAFDYLTLTRIDRVYDNLVLLSYILVAGAGISVIYTYENKRVALFEWLYRVAPLAMQFAFGGLFSGFFIFYSRSASLIASWPFLLILLGLLIGNEFLRGSYRRLLLQIGIFYFVIFSYLIFIIPVLIKSIGTAVFIVSGVMSLAVIALFIRWLRFIYWRDIENYRPILIWVVGGIFLTINLFYFTSIIPPIPLALKDAGVYYSVERRGVDYIGEYEVRSFWRRVRGLVTIYDTVNFSHGQPIYVFSSVFAPTALKTDIIHDWQYFDERRDKWISATRVSLRVVGGRDGGYRGFSFKTNLTEGKWRVDIKTPNNLLIGRTRFYLKKVDEGIFAIEKKIL